MNLRELYARNPDNKNYLLCLALCKKYTVLEVDTAIRILFEEKIEPEHKTLLELLEPNMEEVKYDPNNLKPLTPSLNEYDNLIISSMSIN